MKIQLKKNASFQQVFRILQNLKLTPFETGLMISLITKMLKHSRYDQQVCDYYLNYHPRSLVTSDPDSRRDLKNAFQNFKKHQYIQIVNHGDQKRMFLTFVQIVK